MPVTGLDNVVGRLKLQFQSAKNEKTEAAITEMLLEGERNAVSLTPANVGYLRSTADHRTVLEGNGWAGYVFYGAMYAAAVNRASGKLKGQPRAHFGRTRIHSFFGPLQSKEFGGGDLTGRYWDPVGSQPHFLETGMEEMAQDSADRILKKHYQI
ncbi:MAG: hypothetical protein V4440_05395 [Pseudomonadota bacterium]